MNKNIFKISLLILVISGIALSFIYREQLDPASLQLWVENAGAAAPLLFMLVYIAGTVLFLPGSVITLLGGALFGPVFGTFINLTAATLGAMISFLIARFLAADWVEKKTGGRLKQLVTGVENEGWRFVAFTRLVPLFPFNLLNYALGLSKISFAQYSLATWIFMLPGTFAYTYLGYIGKEAATGGEDLVKKAMLALALLAIVAFIPHVINRMRRGPAIDIDTLKQRIDSSEKLLILDVRPPEDYAEAPGHIANATLLPLEELEQRAAELNAYIDKPVVIICRTDRKSARAARMLTDRGFSDVSIVTMGMKEWNRRGYPIEHA
ncbi:MAG TPA: sulfurtransferase [Gammaproteobacteria bacterium]|nr:sulfurtransferase [Gammaproteobacteria bacterium]